MNDNIVLEVQNLSVAYGQVKVLDHVSLSIERGTMTAIVGPNGAGKSTFVKGLLNLVDVAAGKVSFYGQSFQDARSRIGYVPQRSNIDWDFPVSVLEVVLMGLQKKLKWYQGYTKAHKKMALDALEQVGMDAYANRHIKQLSGGQQQRVFLARALVEQADLYILDEPLVGIDKVTETIIVGQLHKLVDEGKTIMVVHHDLNTIKTYFNHVIMLNKTLVASGDVQSTFVEKNIKETFRETNINVGESYVFA